MSRTTWIVLGVAAVAAAVWWFLVRTPKDAPGIMSEGPPVETRSGRGHF